MLCDCCHNEIPDDMAAYHVSESIYCETCVDLICKDLESWDGPVAKAVRKFLTSDYVTDEYREWRYKRDNWFWL